MGNDSSQSWGEGVIAYYLCEAFERLGHEAKRIAAQDIPMDDGLKAVGFLDLLICDGVPASRIPWQLRTRSSVVVYWWLSELFYDPLTLAKSSFDAVATNSPESISHFDRLGVCSQLIELACPRHFITADACESYSNVCTYLGLFPHKTDSQLNLMLQPATNHDLAIWGRGWEKSQYREYYRGILPLLDVGRLYRSVTVALGLTEERQKCWNMINNRVFEALGGGATLISESFDGLRLHPLGQHIAFTHSAAETADLLTSIRRQGSRRDMINAAQKDILESHTYEHRAADFILLYNKVISTTGRHRRKKDASHTPSHLDLDHGMLCKKGYPLFVDKLTIAVHPRGAYPINLDHWFGANNVVRSTTARRQLRIHCRPLPHGPAKPQKAGALMLFAFTDPMPCATLRFSVAFDKNFNPESGGELPCLFLADQRNADRSLGRQIRPVTYVWSQGTSTYIALRAIIAIDNTQQKAIHLGNINRGGSYVLEQQIILNDPGTNNGILRVWLNATLVVEQASLVYRDSPTTLIEGTYCSAFAFVDQQTPSGYSENRLDLSEFAIQEMDEYAD